MKNIVFFICTNYGNILSNVRDLTIFFKMSLSWAINKLSLISKLKLLESLICLSNKAY